jgi:hypothetical protein
MVTYVEKLDRRLSNIEKYSKELSDWAGVCKKAITELGARVDSGKRAHSDTTILD